MTESALNLFDGVLYINLAKRRDRKKHVEKELKRVHLKSDKIYRIEGYYDELNGCRGCVYSHIKALDFAIAKGWKNVLILEDDCVFTNNQREIHSYIYDFFAHFKKSWDVFFLGTYLRDSLPTSHPRYVQVLYSQRAHAYVVNGPYLSTLREHFAFIYFSMQNDLFALTCALKGLDVQWVYLQKQGRWFSGVQSIAEQYRSLSDIDRIIKPRR